MNHSRKKTREEGSQAQKLAQLSSPIQAWVPPACTPSRVMVKTAFPRERSEPIGDSTRSPDQIIIHERADKGILIVKHIF